MYKKVVETTAAAGLGEPFSRKLFRIADGEYSGRLMALIQISPSEIAFVYADGSYASWSAPVTAADDAANTTFDAVIDDDGHVWLVYSEQSSYYLVSRKLTFANGIWTVGSKTYIYDGAISVEPSVSVESGGKLWVSWSRLSGSYYDIQVKASDDGGQTWGSGASDPGDSITTGLPVGYSRVVLGPATVNVICTGTGTSMLIRSKPRTGGEWSSEFTLASGTGIDQHFDASVSSDGLLGVVFDAGVLKYREYDGNNWGPVITLDEQEAGCPQITFAANAPVITYLCEQGSGQSLMRYVHRRTGSFSVPAILDARAGYLDSVILYDSTSSTYADLTEEAASSTAADVVHPSSGCLLKGAGDVVYLGMEHPYRFLFFLLSTPGVGGTVSWSYFDGSNWRNFTPVGGNFALDAAEKGLLLWDDYHGIPGDWQASSVNSLTRFWIRVEVVSAFSTGPVGSMLTSISSIQSISVRR